MSGSGLMSSQSPKQERFVYPSKGGVAGEVGDLRRDLENELANMVATTVDEYVDPMLGAADSLLAAAATVAAEVVLLPAALTTATLTNMLANPRQLLFTTAGSTPADAPANVAIVGKDPAGLPISETLVLAQTAAAVTSVNFYSEITSLTYPAADGTDATVAIGIGAKLGLRVTPKLRTAKIAVLLELEDGAVAGTAGTFEAASASIAPYGAYTPNSALNGALDFALYYEYDPAA